MKIKHFLTLFVFFTVPISQADMYKNNGFFTEASTSAMMSLEIDSIIRFETPRGAWGYKYDLYSPSANSYLGYAQTDISIGYIFGSLVLDRPGYNGLARINFEYGYEFMKDQTFSLALIASPIIINIDSIDSVALSSDLGISGNIKISRFWQISIQGKAQFLALQPLISSSNEQYPPMFKLKVTGRRYF